MSAYSDGFGDADDSTTDSERTDFDSQRDNFHYNLLSGPSPLDVLSLGIGLLQNELAEEFLQATGLREEIAHLLKGTDVTFSIGHEESVFGYVGETPVNLLIQRDNSKFGSMLGASVTAMVGEHEGVFVTGSFHSSDPSVSAGVFVGVGNQFVMGGINITDAFKGQFTFEPGYLLAFGKESVEYTGQMQFTPIEAVYNTFYSVLGPMLDYRTFMPPRIGGNGF